MSDKYEYPKEIISFVKQIERLEKRGLIISDKLVAKEFLKKYKLFPTKRILVGISKR
jgi:abortive infection bacteriophage resistance protein